MRIILVLLALSLTGCAAKYHVCITADQPLCMRHAMRKGDAAAVGAALSNLGYDPYIISGHDKAGPVPATAPIPEPEEPKTKL